MSGGDNVPFFPSQYNEAELPSAHYAQPMLGSSLDASFPSDEEPPLLDELGIYPEHIWMRTKQVLNPLSTGMDNSFIEDRDVAGPLVFSAVLGAALLAAGKLYMGYVLGLFVAGSLALYALLHLMTEHSLDAYQVISVLGYCLLPVVLLSVAALVIALHSVFGALLAAVAVLWCTKSATVMFESALNMAQQRWLIAYPIAMFYTAFVLFSIW